MSDFSSFFRRLFSKPKEIPEDNQSQMAMELMPMRLQRDAKYQIGEVVKHRFFAFRGVIFDVDPQYANTEEWYNSIPADVRPHRDQPYYHLFAENDKNHYVAYVSEQNLVADSTEDPVNHPDISEIFVRTDRGGYTLRGGLAN